MSPVLSDPERRARLDGAPPIPRLTVVPCVADDSATARVDLAAEAPASAESPASAASPGSQVAPASAEAPAGEVAPDFAESRDRHPAGTTRSTDQRDDRGEPPLRARLHLAFDAARDEGGSLVAEYGLLLVLGATITMLATKWATGGAIWSLFGAVLSRARALVGA